MRSSYVDSFGLEFHAPSGWNKVFLRSKLFEILKVLLLDGPLPEEITHMLGYLTVSGSPMVKIEYLQLLSELLDSSAAPIVLLGMTFCDGKGTIMNLIHHNNTKVRLFSVLIICEIVHLCGVFNSVPKVPIGSRYFLRKNPQESMNATSTNEPSAILDDLRLRPDSFQSDPNSLSRSTLSDIGLPPENLVELLEHFQTCVLEQIPATHDPNNKLAVYQVKFVAIVLCNLIYGKSNAGMLKFLKVRAFRDEVLSEDADGKLTKIHVAERLKRVHKFEDL